MRAGSPEPGLVARLRHQAFFVAGAKAVLAVIVACFVIGAPSAAASQDEAAGYRLAGTLAVGKDFVAFLEVPQGGQILVRAGSVVGNARVLAVNASSLKIALPAGVVELSLDGTIHPVLAASSASVVAKSDDTRNRVYNRQIDDEQVSRDLAAALAEPQAAGSKSSNLVAAQRIAAVLDLPAGSRVLRVQGQEVSSADAVIKQLEASFATVVAVVTMDLQTPTGPGRVYLMREKP
jgi:membrane-associated protease RseP (regulator of RpoE activity)